MFPRDIQAIPSLSKNPLTGVMDGLGNKSLVKMCSTIIQEKQEADSLLDYAPTEIVDAVIEKIHDRDRNLFLEKSCVGPFSLYFFYLCKIRKKELSGKF